MKQTIMTNSINNVRSSTPTKRDDNNAEHHFGVEDGKLTVELYDYSSNPVIKDIDFDGLTDFEEREMYEDVELRNEKLLDNKISGNMQTQDGQSVSNAETHMDYRYFFMNNKNYYDELSTMSLMLCNAMENPDNTEINDIEQLLSCIGMNDNRTTREVVAGGSRVNYITATNDIEYTHNADEIPIKKRVKLIAIKSIIENDSNKNIEHIGTSGDSGYYSNNHKVFDELAKLIFYSEIDYLHNSHQSISTPSNTYWITGYNTGGAVANVLSARIIDNKSSIGSNKDSVGVYAYTFGAPYTVYNYEGQAINTVESKYCSIMNVINESDIYSYIMPQKLGWSRYGMTCIKEEITVLKKENNNKTDRVNTEEKFEEIFYNNFSRFRTKYYETNDKKTDEYIMHEILKGLRTNNLQDVITKIDSGQWTDDLRRRNAYSEFVKDLKMKDSRFKNARNLSVYYNISKAIIPKDVKFRVSSDTKGYKGETSQDYKTAVKKMMEWYTNHIATYQHMHDNIYKDKNGDSYTLYGSNKAEKYYEDNKIASYPINKASLSEIYMTHLSGRGIYYCQPLADKGTHAWVGDDCTGFMMSIAQFYAGNKLKNPDSQDYGNDDFNKNTINSVSTGWFKDDTSYDSASKILKKDADMYTYLINKKTTINDLQFGDILITTSGHAEIYLDSAHTWGWGFKHCKQYDSDGELGWKGNLEKKNIVSSKEYYFIIKNRSIYIKNESGKITEHTSNIPIDNRKYKIVVSPNPYKNNMTPKFK